MNGRATLVAAALAIVACTPQEEEPPVPDTAATGATAEPSGKPAPEVFAATAWRATAEDGARYTTYLDADGSYRDLRNGDAWQTGSWTFAIEGKVKRLCFTPDDENGIERCWRAGRMSGDTLEATGDSGMRIELERVDYQPPAEDDGQA